MQVPKLVRKKRLFRSFYNWHSWKSINEIVFERLHIIISETSILENLLCKGKHFGGLSRFDIALYDEDQGEDF